MGQIIMYFITTCLTHYEHVYSLKAEINTAIVRRKYIIIILHYIPTCVIINVFLMLQLHDVAVRTQK